jgi:hypothetical protein
MQASAKCSGMDLLFRRLRMIFADASNLIGDPMTEFKVEES